MLVELSVLQGVAELNKLLLCAAEPARPAHRIMKMLCVFRRPPYIQPLANVNAVEELVPLAKACVSVERYCHLAGRRSSIHASSFPASVVNAALEGTEL